MIRFLRPLRTGDRMMIELPLQKTV